MVERRQVRSTSIASVGYDGARQRLEVEFVRGAVYQYFGVPSTVVAALLSSESVGRYFAENIQNRFQFTQV